jgi:hypothetical protein
LQGPARLHLRATTPVFEASAARLLKRRLRRCALAAQTLETSGVHDFERQRRLKSLLRCRTDLSGRSQRSIPIERQPIALKAQRPGL